MQSAQRLEIVPWKNTQLSNIFARKKSHGKARTRDRTWGQAQVSPRLCRCQWHLGARHAAKTSFVAWAFLPEIIDTWWWSISFSFWSFQWQTNLSVLQSAQWSLRRESMKSIGCLFDSVLSQVPWALSFFRLQTPFAKLCPIVSDIGQLTKSRPHRECRGFATSVSSRNMSNVFLLSMHVNSFRIVLEGTSKICLILSVFLRALCCIFSRL